MAEYISALIIALCAIISFSPISVRASAVLLAGSQWLGGNGVNVYQNDTGQWQCVELINRLYSTHDWISSYWSGNGYQMYSTAPSHLAKSANGSISTLKPGDVVVFSTTFYPTYGHVGVVNSVNGSTVVTVNQNTQSVYMDLQYSSKTLSYSGASNKITGVVHSPGSLSANADTQTKNHRGYGSLDFNGDGKTDVFTTNGSGWKVSYGGTGGWTTLNSSSYELPSLAFGDFNGDGKTDVFRASSGKWYISYSGTSSWQQVNSSGVSFSELAFADFNGDGKTDVFTTNGSGWKVSYSGTSGWTSINASGYELSSLLIGDFNGDNKSDIFRASSGFWYISYSGSSSWQQVNSSGASLGELATADFDGDGKTDVFTTNGSGWKVSYGGTNGWTTINASSYELASLGFGDFNGDGKADVFRASSGKWYVSYGGTLGWQQVNSSGVSFGELAT